MDANIAAVLVAGIGAASTIVCTVLVVRTKRDVRQVHTQVNSRLDELIRASSAIARSEGHAAGEKAEREKKQ